MRVKIGRQGRLQHRKVEPIIIGEMPEGDIIQTPCCKCGQPPLELHGCPLRAEIYDDYDTECDCCMLCTEDCAQDI